ncbi:MAG: L-threonylcarbamoyladenylate synthase [Clostridia bacterium]
MDIKNSDKYLDLTCVNDISDYKKLEVAGNIIKNGGLVLFPTETVYGLGANGLDAEAVKKIYVAKGRNSDNPLILHISDIAMLPLIAKNISDIEFKLMDAFWPGPFTIILDKTDIVPSVVSGGLDTVGIRMPSNEIAKNLIKYAKTPIAAPSANISGRPSGTNVKDIYSELADKVDYIIDGGVCNIGVESTVVRVIDGIPHILRPGKITAEQIKEIAGDVIIDKHILSKLDEGTKLLSPGMKYKHYAPNTKCVLAYNDNQEQLIEVIKITSSSCIENAKKVVIMCMTEIADYLRKYYKEKLDKVEILDMGNNLEEVSKNIFTYLRKADSYNADLIIIQGVSTDGIGLAIMNRLLRACNYNVIQ